jgi:hypothetical protein
MKGFKVSAFGETIPVTFENCGEKYTCVAGYFDSNNRKIVINISETDSRDYLAVFFHEYFHFVMDRIGFCNTSISHDVEELLVDTISTALVESLDKGEINGIMETNKRVKKVKSKQPRQRKKTG